MSKFSEWLARFEKGRSPFRAPRSVIAVIIIVFFIVDIFAVWLRLCSILTAICAYASALLLLLELLDETGIKVGVKWVNLMKEEEIKGSKPEALKKLSWIDNPIIWYNVHTWFVSPWYYRVRSLLKLTFWSEEIAIVDNDAQRQAIISKYIFRFFALIFLILAINFDICSRLFHR